MCLCVNECVREGALVYMHIYTCMYVGLVRAVTHAVFQLIATTQHAKSAGIEGGKMLLSADYTNSLRTVVLFFVLSSRAGVGLLVMVE